jgi:UDPglucose 6-dehydrogenase/GDP-mannose 6-dehydrogenase
MNVAIIGAGYVGLVTAACLADKGHRVICVDLDRERVDAIRRAVPPIHEPGLEALLRRNAGSRLTATTSLREAVIASDVTLIAVGTPFDGDAIDLGQIREAARNVGDALRDTSRYHVVVVKSTVVPGTTDDVVTPILEAASGKKAGVDFGVGMNPEFLTEGEAVDDFMFPDRLVLGGRDERSLDTLAALYAPFDGVDQLRTNTRTAEMIKYTSNALLATAISFSNEIANLCTALGDIDVVDVMRGLHLSRYLAPAAADGRRTPAPIAAFLWPGCGFGGSCLPKDTRALIAHGRQAGQPMPILDAVVRVNEQQPRRLLALLDRHFPSLQGVRVAILGLAFRPGTDDVRESPAIAIVRALLEAGADVRAYDPAARHQAERLLQDRRLVLCETLKEAVTDVQAVVLVTRWEEFRDVPALLADMDAPPVLIDGRRLLDKRSVARYEGIGASGIAAQPRPVSA